MAKGQMRSNREARKPKKEKTKGATSTSPFAASNAKSATPASGKRK